MPRRGPFRAAILEPNLFVQQPKRLAAKDIRDELRQAGFTEERSIDGKRGRIGVILIERAVHSFQYGARAWTGILERPAICALRERAGFIAQHRAYTNNAAFSESFPQDIQRTLAVLARHATAAGCFAQRERKPD